MTRSIVFIGVAIILSSFQFDVGSSQNFDPGMDDREYLDRIQKRLNEEVVEAHQLLVGQTKALQHVTKAFIETKMKENLFKAVRARVEVELEEMTKANATIRARQARQDDYDDEVLSTTQHPSRQGLLPQLANVVTSLFGSNANVTSYVRGATSFLGPDLSNRFINAASLIDPVRFSTTLAPILINGQLVHPDAIINGTFGQNGIGPGLNLNQAQQSAQFSNPAGLLPNSGIPQHQTTNNVGNIPSAANLHNQVPQSNFGAQYQTRQQGFQQQQTNPGNQFAPQQVNSQNGQNHQQYQFQQPQHNQFQQPQNNQFQQPQNNQFQQPQNQFQQNQFQQPQNQFQQQPQNGQTQQPNQYQQQPNQFQQPLNQFQSNNNLQQQSNPQQQHNLNPQQQPNLNPQQQPNFQQQNNPQQQGNQFPQNQQQQQFPYSPQQPNNLGNGPLPVSNNGQFTPQNQQQQQAGGIPPFPSNNDNYNPNRLNGLNNGPPNFPASDSPLDSNENSNEDNSSAEGENGSVTGTTGRYVNNNINNINRNPTGNYASSSKPLNEEDDDSSEDDQPEDDLPVFYDDISDGDKTTRKPKPKPTTAAPIIAGGYLDEYPAIKYAFKLFNKLTTTKQEIPTTTEYTNVTRKSIDSLEEEEMAATSPSTTTVSRLVQGGVAIYEGAREAYTLLQHLNKFLDRVNDRFETAGYGAEEVGVPVDSRKEK